MREATLHDRRIFVSQDLAGPTPIIADQQPLGLANVGEGTGRGGEVIKVAFLDRDGMIHSVDCLEQGDHPITDVEMTLRQIWNSDRIHVGGVMRLQSTEKSGRLSEGCPAQQFVDHMELKIEDFILTA